MKRNRLSQLIRHRLALKSLASLTGGSGGESGESGGNSGGGGYGEVELPPPIWPDDNSTARFSYPINKYS
ncbi:MAG: hypothetical protein WBB45_21085 [Cyclobacteriaceae bacterium]